MNLSGLRSGFTILDDRRSGAAAEAVAVGRAGNRSKSAGLPVSWPALIDGWKNRGLTPDRVPQW